MAQTLETPIDRDLSPRDFDENTKRALLAIECFGEGAVDRAFCHLEINPGYGQYFNKPGMDTDFSRLRYKSAFQEWKTALTELAAELEKAEVWLEKKKKYRNWWK